MFDSPKSYPMQRFLKDEGYRLTGFSHEGDVVFIYTDSSKWCCPHGSGTFSGATELEAIGRFYDRVQKNEG